MLKEWLESLFVQTASRSARWLGYARETAALQFRHRRLLKDWAPHICASQSALLAGAYAHADERGVAVVIGAGVMEDISLTDLLAYFGELWLVDIAFSRHTLEQARRIGGARVRCILQDVTGVVDRVTRTTKAPADDQIPVVLPLPVPGNLAWIASVNCLTQLPLLPVAWLLRHGEDEAQVERFGRSLIQAHLSQLKAANVPVCLITEMEDRRYVSNRKMRDSTDYRSLLLPFLERVAAVCQSSWEWQTHPPGELPGGEWEIRLVSAWNWGGRVKRNNFARCDLPVSLLTGVLRPNRYTLSL